MISLKKSSIMASIKPNIFSKMSISGVTGSVSVLAVKFSLRLSRLPRTGVLCDFGVVDLSV